MMSPASPEIALEFGVTNSSVIALMTSVFVLAYGELSPSESYIINSSVQHLVHYFLGLAAKYLDVRGSYN